MEPGPLAPDERPTWLISWIVIAVSVVAILISTVFNVDEEADDAEGVPTGEFGAVLLQARLLLALEAAVPGSSADALPDLEAMAKTPKAMCVVVALGAYFADAEEADDEGSARSKLLRKLNPFLEDKNWKKDERLMTAVFQAVWRNELIDEEKSLIQKELGWAGEVLFAAATPQDSSERQALVTGTKPVLQTYFGTLGVVLVAGIVGLILFIFAWVRLSGGRLKKRFLDSLANRGASDRPWVYLEAFAIYLAIMAIPSFTALHDIVAFATIPFSMLAAILWPRFRKMRLKVAARSIGLHRGEGFFKEVWSGLVGYLSILPIVLIGFLATGGLTFLMKVLGDQFGFEVPPPTHPVGDMLKDPSTGQVLGLFFLVSVFAPITEEIMFRGFLYNALRDRWSWMLSGMIMGFLFAAIHPQGILGIPVLMSLGLGFGMIREWRDSLIPSMTAHALHNGAAITAALLMMNL